MCDNDVMSVRYESQHFPPLKPVTCHCHQPNLLGGGRFRADCHKGRTGGVRVDGGTVCVGKTGAVTGGSAGIAGTGGVGGVVGVSGRYKSSLASFTTST
jgi:hypothetical protein